MNNETSPMSPTLATATTEKTVVLPGQTPEGQYILSVLLKRTYQIVKNQKCARAETDQALIAGDVYWDDPMNSSVRYESDFIPFKLATDVVLNGKVYAPAGQPTPTCLASLQVGECRKQVQAIGDRTARFVENGTPEFSEPVPFETIDLQYERAYGGFDVYADKLVPYPYPRNLVGRGFVVKNTKQQVDNLPLPNIEDPGHLLTPEQLCLEDYTQWEKQPIPAGFGWFPKTWLPRAKLAGVLPADRALEQELRQAYAQVVPEEYREAYTSNSLPDIDFKFFNGASRGLILPYLQGGEQIVTENVTSDGSFAFQLAEDQPSIGLDIGQGMQEPEVVLQTVMIRMEEREVDMVWRGAIPYPGPDWLPEMQKMELAISDRKGQLV